MGLSPDIQESADLIMQGLATLMERQQAGANNLPAHLRPYDQADFRSAALGAFVELGELVNECQWKPWRQYGPPTEAEKRKVHKEFGDLLHMLAWMLNNLAERFNIGPDDIALGFMEAHLENVARFKGEVPGREPPRDPNIGMTLGGPGRLDIDENGSWRKLVLKAVGEGDRRVILVKVAEIMEASPEELSPEDQEAAVMLRRYIEGLELDTVQAWVDRES